MMAAERVDLHVRGLAEAEARGISREAKARGERLRQFVVSSAGLRADLERAVRVLLDAGAPVPVCAYTAAVAHSPVSPEDVDRHVRACPVCSAAAVQRLVGTLPAVGWLELARDVGISPRDLPELTHRFAALAERRREVLRDLYGLGDGAYRARLSGPQVAAARRITRERVRQLAEEARKALREGPARK